MAAIAATAVLILMLALAGLTSLCTEVWAETNPGEKISVDVTGQKEGFSAVLYDNSNGLPTSEANAITETSEGFIWIGSYSGLIRYDGNTFERMDSTHGIASVRSLFVDSKDRLWIGTNDSGIFVKEQGEFKRIDSDENFMSVAVRSFAEDADGYIYAATTEGILVIDEKMNFQLIDDAEIVSSYVYDLQVCSDGLIYGVTLNGEAFTLKDRKLYRFYDIDKLGGAFAVAILPDDEHPGNVWIGTDGSEIRYGNLDHFKKSKKIGTDSLTYSKGLEKYGNQLWATADNGIGTYDGKTFKVLDNVPMTHSIDHVMTDYYGNLWFTSSRQGVMKIVANRFEDLFERYDINPTVVNSTCQFQDKLFIGTDDGLIVTDEDGIVKKLPVDSAETASGKDLGQTDLMQMLAGVRIRSILPDTQGNIWLATFSENGMIRFDGKKAVCFTMEEGMPSDRMRAIYERKDGTILVACTGGVVVIDGDRIDRVYNEDDGIINTEILTVVEAENGDIIAGTDGGGIFVIGEYGTKEVNAKTGLSSNVVMRIKKDMSRDIYWIVTSNSIEYMDARYQVTLVKNFPYPNNFDLYQNSKDEMWVISSNGIYVINTDEMVAAKEISPVYYGMDNGLPCSPTANSYSGLTLDGDLFIACSTGVVKVNIDAAFENVNEIKVAVPYVMADGTFIYPDAKGVITIPAATHKTTVYSYVFTYSLDNPTVTYWLDGLETGKTTVKRSDLVPVDYTNLKGGTYHFVIDLSDSMGHGRKELKTTIVKEKKFYEKAWFMILTLVIVLLLLVVVIRLFVWFKTRKYRQKEEENRMLMREISTAFAKTIDMKDKYTKGHSLRVAKYTAMLAEELGCSEEEVEKYYNIALLHDIGKIGIPEEVLNKPGKLTSSEFRVIKSHPTLGYNVLRDISLLPELAIGAGAHHERPDGKGYPKGLQGDEIPRVAQIIAVADCFDAMYSDRPYRSRMNFDKAVSIITEVSGTQLDSEVVDAFLRLVKKGEFKAPDDDGGGSTETIENIQKKEEK